MAGRPLKPIPEGRPAKLLGEKLRALKGDISYHKMGKKANFRPNTLSTTADGTYRGWPSVQQFLDAIKACGGTVTEDDVSECKVLHQIAERLNREQRQPRDLSPPLPPTALTDTVILAPIVNAEQVCNDQPVLAFSHIAPAQACPASLANAATLHDVVTSLVDLVMQVPQHRRLADLGNPRDSGASAPAAEEWEVLTGRRLPTLPVVRSIVVQCGGGAADLARWEQVWRRVTGGGTRAVGVAKVSEAARGSEVRTALDSVDIDERDLLRIRDGLSGTGIADWPTPQPVPWWRRWVRPLARRRPSRNAVIQTGLSSGDEAPSDDR